MSLNKYSSTANRLDIDRIASPSFRAYVHAKAANVAPTLLAELVMFRSSRVVTIGVEGSTTALIKSSKACAVFKKSLVGKTTESLRASKACSVFQGIVRPPTCNAVVWEACQQLLANAAPPAHAVEACTALVKYQRRSGLKVIHTRPFDHGWLLPASLVARISVFSSPVSMLKYVNAKISIISSAPVNLSNERQISEEVLSDNNDPPVREILPTPPASPTDMIFLNEVTTIANEASPDSPKILSKDELFKAFGLESSLTSPQLVYTPRPTKDQLFELFGLNNGLPTPPISPAGIASPLSTVNVLEFSAATSAMLSSLEASDAKAIRKSGTFTGESLMDILASLQSTEKSTRKSLGAPLPRLLFSDPAIVPAFTHSDTTSLDNLASQSCGPSSTVSVPRATPSTVAAASSSSTPTKPRSQSLLVNVVEPTCPPEVKVALTRADIVKREQARFFIKNIAFKSVHLSSAYVSSSTSGPPPPSQLHASESDVFAPGYVLYECDGVALRRLAGLSPDG